MASNSCEAAQPYCCREALSAPHHPVQACLAGTCCAGITSLPRAAGDKGCCVCHQWSRALCVGAVGLLPVTFPGSAGSRRRTSPNGTRWGHRVSQGMEHFPREVGLACPALTDISSFNSSYSSAAIIKAGKCSCKEHAPSLKHG